MGDLNQNQNVTPAQEGQAQEEQPQQPSTVTAPDNAGSNVPSWLPERLERAQKSAVNDLLKTLGVETADELQNRLAALSKFESERQTESERAQAALEKEQKKRETLEQQLAKIQLEQRQTAVSNAISSAATAARAKHADDVVMWVRANGGDLETLLGDDGKVKTADVEALVAKAKEARPDWFRGDGPGSPSNANGQAPEPDAKARAEAQRHQFNMTRSAFN